MNGVVASYGQGKEIHVILDNLNTHKPANDRWLQSHPNVHFHLRQPTLRGSTGLNAGLASCAARRFRGPVLSMSNSYAKQLTTSSPLTMYTRLPLSGVRQKSDNRGLRDNITYFCNYIPGCLETQLRCSTPTANCRSVARVIYSCLGQIARLMR
jgi:hypothetical protein